MTPKVGEVYMGCVLPAAVGQAPARQASIHGAVPGTPEQGPQHPLWRSSPNRPGGQPLRQSPRGLLPPPRRILPDGPAVRPIQTARRKRQSRPVGRVPCLQAAPDCARRSTRPRGRHLPHPPASEGLPSAHQSIRWHQRGKGCAPLSPRKAWAPGSPTQAPSPERPPRSMRQSGRARRHDRGSGLMHPSPLPAA